MSSNIVHQYFKREEKGMKILVKVDPVHLKGTEIIIEDGGATHVRDILFDTEIFADLHADGFTPAGPLEFNLHYKGLV
jgi:hypothetical protein